MATTGNYNTGQVAVGTTPTLITVVPNGNDVVALVNTTAATTVYLGGPNVSTTTGFPLAANAPLDFPSAARLLNPIYGVVAAGTSTVAFAYPSTEFYPADSQYTSDPRPASVPTPQWPANPHN